MQRHKSFARHFFGLWGWLALGAFGLVAVFAVLAFFGSRSAVRLDREGADAIARVTDMRRLGDGDGGTDYAIRYSFTVGDETIEDRQLVSLLFYQGVNEGDTLPVRYWTGDPSLSEIEPGAASSMGRIGMIGATVSGLVALALGRRAWSRASYATWMGRNGFRRQVTVAAHRVTNVRINDVQQWQATWQEADGREGASRMADQHKLPAVGSQITILVDPDGRRESLWEGDVFA
jgi:hypothetical protein